ncbi:efflux RND transporter periplasmic adaptor subunit [Alishewanella longhuensis]
MFISQDRCFKTLGSFSHKALLPLSMAAALLLAPQTLALQSVQQHAHGHAHHPASKSALIDPLAALQPDTQSYTCSMHPQIRFTDPNARCPICGMALIPVPQDDAAESEAASTQGVLRLSPRAAALLQTAVTPVKKAAETHSFTLPGRLAADQSRLQTLSAWTSGRIEQAYVNRTAQQVTAGEPMLEIFSPDLIVIQQELLQAKQLAGRAGSLPAGTTLDSARRRLRLLGVPATQIEQILTREQLQDTVTLSAPVGGIVTEKFVNQGAYVTVGQPLFTVLALDKLWLELEVFEAQLPLIKQDHAFTVAFAAFPGEQFAGKVELIEPELSSNSRTARVRASLSNADGRLKPGMLALATLSQTLPESLLIPATAVLFTGKQSLVYVQIDAEKPHYQPRNITLGQRVGEYYQVLSGIEEGELVVSNGAFRLDSELQIRGLPSMLSAEKVASSSPKPAAAVAPQVVMDGFVLSSALQAPLLAGYQQAYQGLIQDDVALWRQGTLAMQQAVRDIAWPDRFPRIVMALQAGAEDLNQITELEAARALYYRHNLGLLRFAELGVLAQGWYEAYCPMAREGEGASWLQPDSELRNPYFGAMMLRCGDIVRQFSMEE